MGWFDNFDAGSFITNLLPSLVTAGGTAYAVNNKPSDTSYGNTQAGFEANLQLQKDKLAQDKELALLALQKQGDGGSGAALAAAQLNFKAQMAALKERYLADRLSAVLSSRKQAQDTLSVANQDQVRAAQAVGNAGLQGFNGIGQVLSSFRGR